MTQKTKNVALEKFLNKTLRLLSRRGPRGPEEKAQCVTYLLNHSLDVTKTLSGIQWHNGKKYIMVPT